MDKISVDPIYDVLISYSSFGNKIRITDLRGIISWEYAINSDGFVDNLINFSDGEIIHYRISSGMYYKFIDRLIKYITK